MMTVFWPIVAAGGVVVGGVVFVLVWLELERMIRGYGHGGGAPSWLTHLWTRVPK